MGKDEGGEMGEKRKGLIHVYCGEGKGKTTAALGLCLRAYGRGFKVLWTSFLKDYQSGEFMKEMPFDLYKGKEVRTFLYLMGEEERRAVEEEHRRRMGEVMKKCMEEHYDLLVMDELLGAIETGTLSEEEMVEMIRNKPESLELVITGRYLPNNLAELADYITVMTPLKHPYDKGVSFREGIEN